MKDLFHNLLAQFLLLPVVLTTSQVSVGVDRKGFEAITLDTMLGASGDTLSGSVLLELILEESDTLGSGYTAVTNNDHVLLPDGETVDGNGRFLLVDDPAEDELLKSIGYRGLKQFIRINTVLTGTHTNGIPVSVQVSKGKPNVRQVQ